MKIIKDNEVDMKKEMTKKELINSITQKVKKADPQVQRMFKGFLKYQTKTELKKINKKVKVTYKGNEIKWD